MKKTKSKLQFVLFAVCLTGICAFVVFSLFSNPSTTGDMYMEEGFELISDQDPDLKPSSETQDSETVSEDTSLESQKEDKSNVPLSGSTESGISLSDDHKERAESSSSYETESTVESPSQPEDSKNESITETPGPFGENRPYELPLIPITS